MSHEIETNWWYPREPNISAMFCYVAQQSPSIIPAHLLRLLVTALGWHALFKLCHGPSYNAVDRDVVEHLHSSVFTVTTQVSSGGRYEVPGSSSQFTYDSRNLTGWQAAYNLARAVVGPELQLLLASDQELLFATMAGLVCYPGFLRLQMEDMVWPGRGVRYLDHVVLDSSAGPGTVTGFNQDGQALVNGTRATRIVTARDRWVTPVVMNLARSVAADFDTKTGGLAPVGLYAVADALEEEGCNLEPLLKHLRGYHPCGNCVATTPAPCPYCSVHRYFRFGSMRYLGTWGLSAVLGY